MVLPRVQPIIPTSRKEPFDDPEWLFEFKYDGFRGLCYLEQGCCRNLLSRFEALGAQLALLMPKTRSALLSSKHVSRMNSSRFAAERLGRGRWQLP